MLKVRNIFETANGFSKVSVNTEVFKAIAGFNPTLPYTTSRNANGNGVRVYDVDGVPVYTQYDKESKKTAIIMKTSDANKHLQTLESERENEVALAFTF
jgi:hypothetical protein